jgi:DNA-binding transcriptional MerR regulator
VLVYLEALDVGRELGFGPAAVRYHENLGRLKPAATTVRGTRLFLKEDVEIFRRLYGIRRKRRNGRGRTA